MRTGGKPQLMGRLIFWNLSTPPAMNNQLLGKVIGSMKVMERY
jgi:hypothetical protein